MIGLFDANYFSVYLIVIICLSQIGLFCSLQVLFSSTAFPNRNLRLKNLCSVGLSCVVGCTFECSDFWCRAIIVRIGVKGSISDMLFYMILIILYIQSFCNKTGFFFQYSDRLRKCWLQNACERLYMAFCISSLSIWGFFWALTALPMVVDTFPWIWFWIPWRRYIGHYPWSIPEGCFIVFGSIPLRVERNLGMLFLLSFVFLLVITIL